MPAFIDDDGNPNDGGDLPVVTIDDVAAEWAEAIQEPTDAPVRDAIQAGQTALFLEWQRRSSIASALSDPLRTEGIYADAIGEERNVQRSPGEPDLSYVPRLNASPKTVSPDDIVAAANVILAPVSAVRARYLEQSDGWFVGDGASVWSSHVFDGSANATPNYPDRLYADATPAGLQAIPNRRPGGARIFSDPNGRYFELRVPDISPVDQRVTLLRQDWRPSSSPGFVDPHDGLFMGDGTSSVNTSYMWDLSQTSSQIYDAIVDVVESIRGHSMRWTMLVDAQLLT